MSAPERSENLTEYINAGEREAGDAAAGGLRQKNPEDVKKRKLHMICHGIGAREGFTPQTQHEAYEKLSAKTLAPGESADAPAPPPRNAGCKA